MSPDACGRRIAMPGVDTSRDRYLVPGLRLNASLSHLAPPRGDIAFVSQSGAMITAMLDWAVPRGIGFSLVVSLGDMADVDFGDMLDWLATEQQTRALLLYA